MINILELDHESLTENLLSTGMTVEKYRCKQILQNIYKKCILDFEFMTDLSKQLRGDLSSNFKILAVKEEQRFVSTDGTMKFLFVLEDNNAIEAVYLKDKNKRVTFCVSSQVGCRMGCKFCKTGRMGLLRNLTASEILSEVLYLWSIMRQDSEVTDTMFNIVFMGMGEPLDNIDNLLSALDKLTNPNYIGMSPTRITISTCGLVDRIENVLNKFNVNFALSLNASREELRKQIMPVTNAHGLEEIRNTMTSLAKKYNKRFTLEYVMLANFNIAYEDALALKVFNPKYFLINLIPLNHSDEKHQRPTEGQIKTFSLMLTKLGLNFTRRYRRGADIEADCGQLFLDRAKLNGAKEEEIHD